MASKRKSKLNNDISPKITNIIVVIILFILSLAVLANTMSKPVGRDEQMYCTGAALMAQGKMIYRDFSYAAQMPYHPLLCATLFKLFGTTHYLLTVRLLSCFCDILVLLGIVVIYRHIFRSFTTSGMILGLCAAVLPRCRDFLHCFVFLVVYIHRFSAKIKILAYRRHRRPAHICYVYARNHISGGAFIFCASA